MNTEMKLLKSAAKAVGYTISKNGHDINGLQWYWCEQLGDNWNPLVDDGDALRLLVDTDMTLVVDKEVGEVHVGRHNFTQDIVEGISDDPHASTRRAIVRAAAKIGKTK